jgi:hypothetical protein
MNCYECAKNGTDTAAVVVCPSCGAGLCLSHLRREQLEPGPGGTQIGCSHDTWRAPVSTTPGS